MNRHEAREENMQVDLIAYTQQNPALTPNVVAGRSDLATIANGHGTYPEKLIEYAGRVCYRSTHRMGTAPGFIVARVREGHEDIIEHVVVTCVFAATRRPETGVCSTVTARSAGWVRVTGWLAATPGSGWIYSARAWPRKLSRSCSR